MFEYRKYLFYFLSIHSRRSFPFKSIYSDNVFFVSRRASRMMLYFILRFINWAFWLIYNVFFPAWHFSQTNFTYLAEPCFWAAWKLGLFLERSCETTRSLSNWTSLINLRTRSMAFKNFILKISLFIVLALLRGLFFYFRAYNRLVYRLQSRLSLYDLTIVSTILPIRPFLNRLQFLILFTCAASNWGFGWSIMNNFYDIRYYFIWFPSLSPV